MSKIKNVFNKIWNFLFEEDSIFSWITILIISFLLIKFVVYPILSLLFGTSLPLVTVVSGSMEHRTVSECVSFDDANKECLDYSYVMCGNFYNESQEVDLDFYWNECSDKYLEKDISFEEFQSFPFNNGINTGDIVILFGTTPEDVSVGDVLVFRTSHKTPIIHRIIGKWSIQEKTFFKAKGDHNEKSLNDELAIREEQILGKAVFRIPLLGYIKIYFNRFMIFFGLDKYIS